MSKKSIPPRYAELQVTTNFSFLRGASHGEELVAQAQALGLSAIAVTDRNTLAGVVRAHVAAKELGLKLIVGARLDLRMRRACCACRATARPTGACRACCRSGRCAPRRAHCTLYLDDVAQHAEGQIFIALAPDDWDWRAVAAADDATPRTAAIIPFSVVLSVKQKNSPSPSYASSERALGMSCGASRRRWAERRSIWRRATPIAATTARASPR